MTGPLTSLADRVEGAGGPSRELDAGIWLTCVSGATRSELRYTHKASGKECVIDETRENGRLVIVPAYTNSLDAALTLVPEGYEWSVNWAGNSVAELRELPDGWPVHGHAATPALALCAAALRARATLGDAS